jgi:NAD(P)-dependent dehydrogenase (short-subunit alcohol dehydrogenase family)
VNSQKVILITGGRTGLGLVIAMQLLRGGNIVYCTSRSPNVSKDSGINFLKMDVTSNEEIRKVIDIIISREGRIDVLVNNAGITLTGQALNFSPEDFQNIIDVNVIGPFRIIKLIFFKQKKELLIINITSLSGIISLPNYGLYSSSKFAMEALGIALKYEVAPSKIRVVNMVIGALHSSHKQLMMHKPVREKSILIKWIMPLTAPETVAIAILKLIHISNPPTRVLIGRDSHVINMIQKVLPMYLIEKIILYFWKK